MPVVSIVPRPKLTSTTSKVQVPAKEKLSKQQVLLSRDGRGQPSEEERMD